MSEPALDRLERWFLEVVTHPDGVEAGEEQARDQVPATIDELLLPSAQLTAAQRIGIYSGMYFARLVDVLEEDFPALLALLGEDGAVGRRLFGEFVVAHPSRHQNLNRFGRLLPAFVESQASEVPHRAFAAELARLERDVQEVFDAREAEPLTAHELLAIQPAEWSELTLRPAPSLRVRSFAHPVNAWYQAWRDGEAAAAPDPAPSYLALYRKEYRVWRLPLSFEEFTLLSALVAGQPLGAALEALAGAVGNDLSAIGESLQTWLRDWTGLGFFVSAERAE